MQVNLTARQFHYSDGSPCHDVGPTPFWHFPNQSARTDAPPIAGRLVPEHNWPASVRRIMAMSPDELNRAQWRIVYHGLERAIRELPGHSWLSLYLQIANSEAEGTPAPIPMILHCPACGLQHVDRAEAHEVDECPASGEGCSFGPHGPEGQSQCEYCGLPPHWTNPPHRSHLCAGCGHLWRPADVATMGVERINTRGRDDSPMTGAYRVQRD